MALSADIPIDELERRMRPGAWSHEGFLGEDERLEDVLQADRQTLKELGLTVEELAHSLERLLSATEIFWLEGSEDLNLGPERVESARASIKAVEQALGHVETQRTVLGDLAIVGGRYEVFTIAFAGSQECPWSRSPAQACAWASTDWAIRDRHRDLRMRGPSLIVHLIREHGFFEGPASPYRVDPRELAELLRMGPFSEASRSPGSE
jgi:hypothetical protein